MACRSVHFAIDDSVVDTLLQSSDDEIVDIIQEDIEETWDEEWLCETDKAWDAIHRCLTDGRLEWNNGEYPLNRAILEGERLTKCGEYIVCLVPANDVLAVATSLRAVSSEELRQRYFAIPVDDYGAEVNEDDFEYTKENFEDLARFFSKASEAGKAVIFTVDQ